MRKEKAVKKWENRVITRPFCSDCAIEEFLNEMGQEGWQPVSFFADMARFRVIFKREIPGETEVARAAETLKAIAALEIGPRRPSTDKPVGLRPCERANAEPTPKATTSCLVGME
jgi:hypothetical protein